MPTRDEPRLTIRLDSGLDGRLGGAARGAGVRKGTLARRAMELGLDAAIEEARAAGDRHPPSARIDASPAARGGRPRVVGGAEARLDGRVAADFFGGDMMRARRAINAGQVFVAGETVRDPMAMVPDWMGVAVDA